MIFSPRRFPDLSRGRKQSPGREGLRNLWTTVGLGFRRGRDHWETYFATWRTSATPTRAPKSPAKCVPSAFGRGCSVRALYSFHYLFIPPSRDADPVSRRRERETFANSGRANSNFRKGPRNGCISEKNPVRRRCPRRSRIIRGPVTAVLRIPKWTGLVSELAARITQL